MSSDIKKICYFGIYGAVAPRDKVYLDGLKKLGIEIVECVDNSPGLLKFFRLAKKHRALLGKYDILWVGYLSTMTVFLAKIISRKRIIFNALDSWYDRTVRDRGIYSRFSPKAIIIWIFDFLAFHCADVVLVESEAQKKFIVKEFHVSPKKIEVVFTGADSEVFFADSSVKKRDRFTVMFRSIFAPATGVEFVLEAARLLKNEPVDFIIVGWGPLLEKVRLLISKNELTNVTLITEFLSPKVLRELMLSCNVMLGQFGNHPRLERTIQHKTFEAMALGMPYITGNSVSNREILTDGVDCIFVSPDDSSGIAEKILFLEKNDSIRALLSKNALTKAVSIQKEIERMIEILIKISL